MSKKNKKGKNLEFKNMTVHYDFKQDVFHITSNDKDLLGKPFKITLNNTSEAEKTLRKLFLDKGIIGNRNNNVLPSLPDYKHSEDYTKIPLGVTYDGKLEWDFKRIPHLLIEGNVGSGSSLLFRSVINHCEIFYKDIELKLFGDAIEYDRSIKNNHNIYSNSEEIISALDEINLLIEERYRILESENLSNHYNLSKPFKSVVVLIQDYSDLFEKAKDTGTKEHIKYLLHSILRKGRAVGIHVVVKDKFSNDLLKEKIIARHLIGCIIAGNSTLGQSHNYLGNDRAGRGLIERGYAYANFTHESIIDRKYSTLFSMYWTPEEK